MIALGPVVSPPVMGNVATTPDKVAGPIADGTREFVVSRSMKA